MEDDESLDLANADLSGPNSFLTNEEENCILQWFWDFQCEKCPTCPELRGFAEALQQRRADDGRPCGRFWWHSFKAKHPELKAITVNSVESASWKVAGRDVLAYFGELKMPSHNCGPRNSSSRSTKQDSVLVQRE
jgi:hypothetical protein